MSLPPSDPLGLQWAKYLGEVIPPEAGQTQVLEAKLAFYGGAQAALGLVLWDMARRHGREYPMEGPGAIWIHPDVLPTAAAVQRWLDTFQARVRSGQEDPR